MNLSFTKSAIRNLLLVFCTLIVASPVNAQFDKLLDRTTRKLTRELEDMAVEKISDVIAQKAAEAVEKEFDKLLMEAMKEDSAKYDRDSAYYALGNSYGQFLKGLNDAADLPESYSFDLDILYEVTTQNEKPEKMRYYFSSSQPIMGIQTAKSETNWQFVVIDVGNDVTVLYQHDGDKKTAQAIPNMMKFAGNLAQSQGADVEGEFDYEINKLPGKKRVAGYKCEGWEGKSENQRFESWMTNELGVDWKQTFGEMVSQFAGTANYQQSWSGMEGMVMMSESYEDDKLISSMEAQEVGKKETKFVNADYEFGYQQ